MFMYKKGFFILFYFLQFNIINHSEKKIFKRRSWIDQTLFLFTQRSSYPFNNQNKPKETFTMMLHKRNRKIKTEERELYNYAKKRSMPTKRELIFRPSEKDSPKQFQQLICLKQQKHQKTRAHRKCRSLTGSYVISQRHIWSNQSERR